MQNKTPQFGDLSRLEVSINGQNITEAITQILVFQDMASPFMTCQIDMVDTVNMITQYGFASNSQVVIRLSTTQGHDTDGEAHLAFRIHEIGNKRQLNHKAFAYTIQCAQEEFIINQKARVCKAFPSKRPDKIVKEIVQDKLKASVGDTKPEPEQLHPHTAYVKDDGQRIPSKASNEVSYIAANVTPLTAIAYMCKVALNGKKADFLFFTKTMQKGKAKFAFESLSNMWMRKPHVKFVQRPNHIRKHGDIRDNKNLEFQSLSAHHVNAIVNMASGYDANTVMTFDVEQKTWEPKDERRKHGKNKLGTKDSNIVYLPKPSGLYDEGEDIFAKGQEWYSSRRTNLFNIEQNRLTLQLTGQPKAFNWLGEICEVDIPSANSMSNENLDEKYKGQYMIIAVAHVITRTSYHVNVEIANGWDK